MIQEAGPVSRDNSTAHVIFDLDGTLIDSYPGIQAAFNQAFEQVYNRPCPYDIRSLVGPPIKEIFLKVNSEADPEKTTSFVSFFRKIYDEEQYANCTVYPGIEDVLTAISGTGLDLYIATNKRLNPTRLILTQLGIAHFFKQVYSVDSVTPHFATKELMIRHLINAEGLEPGRTVFIGDTHHDEDAARENGIRFLYASYGYGELKNTMARLDHISDVISHL